MKRLLLLRHAKAEPPASDADDHDRALAPRGIADAAMMARYLQRQGFLHGRILCSTAQRTRQTAAAVLAVMPGAVEYLDTLYLALPGRILSLLQQGRDGEASLLVVGHNPGLEQCASLLAREPVRRKEQQRFDLLEEKFPTAALAVLDFDIAHWRELTPGGGRLADFARPSDLSF